MSFHKKQTKDGREFILLELNGGLEFVQSMTSGQFYATVRKCSVPINCTEQIAESLIGTQVPGKIVRVATDPYEYAVPSSGEVITLAHQWSYQPESSPVMPQPVMA